MPITPESIPLSLYVHVPWCVRKCPYCDFNSHAAPESIPESAFVRQLLADLEQDTALVGDRALKSIFIGGGTPSLLAGETLNTLLSGIRQRLNCEPDMEVTLEANPGTAEAGRFSAYRRAGVNRLSIGVQSFNQQHLDVLGRIHSAEEAQRATHLAREAGFNNLNLDLMFGLPGQSLMQAREDLQRALELMPDHLSYYQLTLEPNTLFHARPPELPDQDLCWDIQQQGQAMLAEAGFEQYEVSAYARPGRRCAHNLNYWRFGDYLGVGPGAHGLLTDMMGQRRRRWKQRHPEAYLQAGIEVLISGERSLNKIDLCEEFLLNALRLVEGFAEDVFVQRTGLPLLDLHPGLERARSLGLVVEADGYIRASEQGFAFLNDLLALFSVGNDEI